MQPIATNVIKQLVHQKKFKHSCSNRSVRCVVPGQRWVQHRLEKMTADWLLEHRLFRLQRCPKSTKNLKNRQIRCDVHFLTGLQQDYQYYKNILQLKEKSMT
jgi:hypothetical protein